MSKSAIVPQAQLSTLENNEFYEIMELARYNLGSFCQKPNSDIKISDEITFSNFEDYLYLLNEKCKKYCKFYQTCDLIDWSKEILKIYDRYVF
ncbi:MAG: hypothetical protein ACTSRX_01460 [Promethearchaeota archaeon]